MISEQTKEARHFRDSKLGDQTGCLGTNTKNMEMTGSRINIVNKSIHDSVQEGSWIFQLMDCNNEIETDEKVRLAYFLNQLF